MNTDRRRPIGQSRELLHQLRNLGDVRAPTSVLPAVLERVGLGDAYAQIDTPIGPVFVAYSKLGISTVRRAASAQEFEQIFRERFDRPVRRTAELLVWLTRMLKRQLSGKDRSVLRIDLRRLTEFERAVLLKVMEIPRGEVRPYAWVAQEIGHPRAVRAVGAVLGRNPAPLLIPCHRVVRSDGDLGDYIFGNDAKREVLTAEGVDVEELEHLAHAGVRYYGSDTTHVYCLPTCRNARRITDRHRVPFRSDTEAGAAGYRPCRVCRPARAS